MKIKFDEECKSCKGTGLYIGLAEKDGAAVVCSTCKGTGCYRFSHEYEKFTGRKENKKIKRVFKTNPGVMIGISPALVLADFGGIPYYDWHKGVAFPEKSEMRKFSCPAWWYQCVDYGNKKPRWKECIVCGTFSSCPSFKKKENCWMRWDVEEFGSKGE